MRLDWAIWGSFFKVTPMSQVPVMPLSVSAGHGMHRAMGERTSESSRRGGAGGASFRLPGNRLTHSLLIHRPLLLLAIVIRSLLEFSQSLFRQLVLVAFDLGFDAFEEVVRFEEFGS